ncbi:hypothetical protein L9G15_06635 [Shewanella sp. A3A]|uniref:Uncharacterized protein n=1 Tax=Shewanella electrica TaxID=515560 RepID=A0ABT2FTU9_9GAMM|nr:hypothetical protein [Shewanella electrica]MCH1919110.1 hypothetical protein [Shewanella ferrihydritica]MCH1926980.1 hypothetical protein [Shewanella electrica]MCS4558601.1 hypothetical protein [Shewanella electrica]
MRNIILLIIAAVVVILLSATLIGGEDNTSAEDIGEKIDNTMTDAGNAVEDKCEELKEQMGSKETNC